MILFVGDLHYGVAKDDPWIQNIQRESVQQTIDICKKENIDTIIQFGDWFDVRKAITHVTMEFSREMVELYREAGINIIIIPGNHDLHYKNQIHPNSVTELLSRYDNITIYDKPTTVDIDGTQIDLIPWMCEENTADILKHIKESSAEYCIGHWELNGFYFYKGMKSHGLEPDFLKKYKQVYSGHFHTISEAGNVKYIGTPYSITSGDEDDPRGVWTFDGKTGKTKFYQNPVMWHQKVYYPNTKINFEDYRNIAVRLVVNKVDADLAKFESQLEEVVHTLKIISVGVDAPEFDSDEEVTIESLEDLISSYIDNIEGVTPEEIEKLKKYSSSLLIEARSQ